MADYKKMYAVLCGAVDDVIDDLEKIPIARTTADILRKALLQAEEIYITTTPYSDSKESNGIVKIMVDKNNKNEP